MGFKSDLVIRLNPDHYYCFYLPDSDWAMLFTCCSCKKDFEAKELWGFVDSKFVTHNDICFNCIKELSERKAFRELQAFILEQSLQKVD